MFRKTIKKIFSEIGYLNIGVDKDTNSKSFCELQEKEAALRKIALMCAEYDKKYSSENAAIKKIIDAMNESKLVLP